MKFLVFLVRFTLEKGKLGKIFKKMDILKTNSGIFIDLKGIYVV